jgi:Ca2+-binding EF-hand superfamily protein
VLRAGFLTYDEFRDVIGQDCLNLGFNESEVSTLIAAVDTSNKGAITYADLSRRMATADIGRDHDAMLAASARELQVSDTL